MAAPLVPLSQQVWCWGAPRDGAGGWCGGKGEAPRKRGSRERRRRRAPRARAALKVTGRRGPRNLAPGDPPRSCEEVTGRGRRACLLRRVPARLAGACEPRRASSPRRWARAVGPVGSLCLPRGRASGRMASLRGAARGSGTRRSASGRPALLPLGAASAAPARCEKRGSHAPTVGARLRPQSLPILLFFLFFLKSIRCHRDVQKSHEKALVLLAESFIHSSAPLTCVGSGAGSAAVSH